MNKRAALLATVLLTTGAGAALSPAHAAPACNLVTDAAGDSAYAVVPGDDGDDVLSGDISSDGKTVTVAIRLASLQATSNMAPLGHAFYFDFNAPGSTAEALFIGVRTYPDNLGGVKWVAGYSASDPVLPLNTSYALGDSTKGILDTAKNEIRVTTPVSTFTETGAKIEKGSKLTGFAVRSYRNIGQGLVPSQSVGPARAPIGGVSEPFDNTEESTASYVVGDASCLSPVV